MTVLSPYEFAQKLADICNRTGKADDDIMMAAQWVTEGMMTRKGWGRMDQAKMLRFIELVLNGVDPFMEVSDEKLV